MRVNGVGLLSRNNKKVQAPTWSISRKSCKNACGSVCKACYAAKNCYIWPCVKNALEKRHEWFEKTPKNEVIETLSKSINGQKSKYVRVFESGDFSSVRSIRIWHKIIENCPTKKFWVPTKGYRSKVFLRCLVELNKLPNVAVKPSSTEFDVSSPKVGGLSAGATSFIKQKPKNHRLCKGDCAKCRACWSKKIEVAYRIH